MVAYKGFSLPRTHRKDFIMSKSKELHQDLRNVIIEKHSNWNGYRYISKMLNVPVSTVGAIESESVQHKLVMIRCSM